MGHPGSLPDTVVTRQVRNDPHMRGREWSGSTLSSSRARSVSSWVLGCGPFRPGYSGR